MSDIYKPIKYRSDNADTLRCYAAHGPTLKRCVGGRLVVDGYICPHCGSNSPDTECKSPNTAGEP